MYDIGKLLRVDLGRVGEHLVEMIDIDMREWMIRWPNGHVTVRMHRPREDYPYPAGSVMDEHNILHIPISAEDVAISGVGGMEITLHVPINAKGCECACGCMDDIGEDEKPVTWRVKRSQIVRTVIKPDMAHEDDLDMTAEPADAQSWLDTIQIFEGKAKCAARCAMNAAHRAMDYKERTQTAALAVDALLNGDQIELRDLLKSMLDDLEALGDAEHAAIRALIGDNKTISDNGDDALNARIDGLQGAFDSGMSGTNKSLEDLRNALDGKSDVGHTHVSDDITDWPEQLEPLVIVSEEQPDETQDPKGVNVIWLQPNGEEITVLDPSDIMTSEEADRAIAGDLTGLDGKVVGADALQTVVENAHHYCDQSSIGINKFVYIEPEEIKVTIHDESGDTEADCLQYTIPALCYKAILFRGGGIDKLFSIRFEQYDADAHYMIQLLTKEVPEDSEEDPVDIAMVKPSEIKFIEEGLDNFGENQSYLLIIVNGYMYHHKTGYGGLLSTQIFGLDFDSQFFNSFATTAIQKASSYLNAEGQLVLHSEAHANWGGGDYCTAWASAMTIRAYDFYAAVHRGFTNMILDCSKLVRMDGGGGTNDVKYGSYITVSFVDANDNDLVKASLDNPFTGGINGSGLVVFNLANIFNTESMRGTYRLKVEVLSASDPRIGDGTSPVSSIVVRSIYMAKPEEAS